MREWTDVMRAIRTISISAVLLLAALAGCGGDGDDPEGVEKKAKPLEGTFVGKAKGEDAFVAVVASPAARGSERRELTVYACDAKRVCEWFSGSATGNSFRVAAERGDGEARGELSRKATTGTIELRNGKTLRYEAEPATAAAGLYDLTVTSSGKLTGASATGVGLSGKSTIPKPGDGSLKLADGKRLKLDVTRSSARGSVPLRAGQVLAIVLPDHQLRGAARSRRTAGGGDSDFFIRAG
jgi:hypothetical protein